MGRNQTNEGRHRAATGEEKSKHTNNDENIVRRLVRCKLDVDGVSSAMMEEYTSTYRAAVRSCQALLHRVIGDPYGLHPPRGSKLRSLVHNGCYHVLRSEYPLLPAMMLSAAMEDATDAFISTLVLLRTGNYRAKFSSNSRVGIGLIQQAYKLDPDASHAKITRTASRDHGAWFRAHCGKEPRRLLMCAVNRQDNCRLGEARLVERQHNWFLDIAVNQNISSKVLNAVHWSDRTFIGVDLGLNDLATSVALLPGEIFSPPITVPGGTLKNQLTRLRRQRAAADGRGDLYAGRAIELQRRNVIRHWSHVAARRIVEYARRFKYAVIVLEDLETFSVEASQHSAQTNYLLSSWARGLLKKYISYKAKLCGIQMVSVDPYGSTRFCNRCGAWTQYLAASNWRVIKCPRCGFSTGRDVNAAMNLAVRGRYLGAASLLLFLLGCANSQAQPLLVSEYLRRNVTKALNRQVIRRHNH